MARASRHKSPAEEPSFTNLEPTGSCALSARSRDHRENSLEVNDWSLERSHRLSPGAVEKNVIPEDVLVIDRASLTSVVEAVEALNRGSVACLADACVVYSASNRCHYLLWRQRCENLPALLARLGVSYKAAIEQPQEKMAPFRRSLTPTRRLDQSGAIIRTSSLKTKSAPTWGGLASSPQCQSQKLLPVADPPTVAPPSRCLPSRISNANSEPRVVAFGMSMSSQATSSLSPRELCQAPSCSGSALQSKAGSIRASEGQISPLGFSSQSNMASPVIASGRPVSPLRSSGRSPAATMSGRAPAENRTRSLDTKDSSVQSGLQFRFRGRPGPRRGSIGSSLQESRCGNLTPPVTGTLSSCKSSCGLLERRNWSSESQALGQDLNTATLAAASPPSTQMHTVPRRGIPDRSDIWLSQGRSLSPAEVTSRSVPMHMVSGKVISDRSDSCLSQGRSLSPGPINALRTEPKYDSKCLYTEVNASAERTSTSVQMRTELRRVPPGRSDRCLSQGRSLSPGPIVALRAEPKYDPDCVYTEVNASYPVALLLNQIVDEWLRIPPPALGALAWNPATLKCHLSGLIKKTKNNNESSQASITENENEEDLAFARALRDEHVWLAFDRAVRRSCLDCTLGNNVATKILSTVRTAISRGQDENDECDGDRRAMNVNDRSRADWAALDISPRGPWGFPMTSLNAKKEPEVREKTTETDLQHRSMPKLEKSASSSTVRLEKSASSSTMRLEKSASSSSATTQPVTPVQDDFRLQQAMVTSSSQAEPTQSTRSIANAYKQFVERYRSRSTSSQASSRFSSHNASRERCNRRGKFAYPAAASAPRSRDYSPRRSQSQWITQPHEAEYHGASLYAELCKLQDHQLHGNVNDVEAKRMPLSETKQWKRGHSESQNGSNIAMVFQDSKKTESRAASHMQRPCIEAKLRSDQAHKGSKPKAQLERGMKHIDASHEYIQEIDSPHDLALLPKPVPPFPLLFLNADTTQQVPECMDCQRGSMSSSLSPARLRDDKDRLAGSSMSPRQMELAEHLSGRHSPKESSPKSTPPGSLNISQRIAGSPKKSSAISTPRVPDDNERLVSSSLIAQLGSPRRPNNQPLAATLRMHKFPEAGQSDGCTPDEVQAIAIGAQVEAFYNGGWYLGTVLALPEGDELRFLVQCDVDDPGVRTYTKHVRSVQAAACVGPEDRSLKDSSSRRGGSSQGAVICKRHDRDMTVNASSKGKPSSKSLRRTGGHREAEQERGVTSKRTQSAGFRSRSPQDIP